MLAYVLALTVGLGSLAIYMVAFFFPEIHRKNDFIWSGVGLFYAWVLWVCAGRINGGLLLGQMASVALLGWSVTQTLSLRRQLTPRLQQTELPSAEEVKNTVREKVSNLSLTQRFSELGKQVGGSATAAKARLQQTIGGVAQHQSELDKGIDKSTPIPDQSASTPATAQLITDTTATASEPKVVTQASEELVPETTPVAEPIRPHPPDPELVEAAVHDAEEKRLEASPPEVEPENPSPS